MTPPIDHDQLFRQLLETFFADFVELFAPALAQYLDLSQLTFLPQQYFTDILDGDRKAIDILVQVPVKPSEMDAQQSVHTILLHVENQSTSRSNFAQRVFFYLAGAIEVDSLARIGSLLTNESNPNYLKTALL
jgi:predicted transposase/invertase (TIGR01784 family)